MHKELTISGALLSQIMATIIIPPVLWYDNLDILTAMMEPNEVEDLWIVGALRSTGHCHRTVLAMPSSNSRGLDISEFQIIGI